MKRRRKEGFLCFDELTNGIFFDIRHSPTHGFRWEDEKVTPLGLSEYDKLANHPPWLIRVKKFDTATRYPPLELPNLHMEFISLWVQSGCGDQIDLELIRQFANKYGFLGHGKDCNVSGWATTDTGESYGYWVSKIINLTCLTKLWNLIKYERESELKPYAGWTRNAKGLYAFRLELKPYPPCRFGISFYANEEDIEAKPGELIKPAKHFLFDSINKNLEEHVHPRLIYFEEEYEMSIYMQPDCLFSTMNLLLAVEISEFINLRKTSKTCRGCGTYFKPVHGHQKYCKPNCQWRTNKRKQRRLKKH